MPKKPTDEARRKFLEALDKKKQRGVAGAGSGPASGSKLARDSFSGSAPNHFQRKSNSI